ncbi:MAG TPA: TIGR04222 domain-containing membrane protein [Rariglobus sp.]|nr:TIGR04222 domain-containing membrane protein [Rariglobus sp.]
MNSVHAELWAKLEAFDPDEPDATFSFSQRLARENGWSRDHALRVIAEYRRFVFLAVTAGHPVSPSDAIDQAWHLHLTYTRSYWDTLCGEILRQPFHHQPTRGGDRERAKFGDWYARTLASYRAAFNESPPADLWPPAGRPSPETAPLFRRVDIRRFWLIPRPRAHQKKITAALAAIAGLLVIAGCNGGGPFPGAALFDLRGPDFLKFYLTAFPLAVLIAAVLRWWWRVPSDDGREVSPDDVDPYVVAHLAGKTKRVALTALTQLANDKAVRLDNSSGGIEISRMGELSSKAHPIERHLYQSLPKTGSNSFSLVTGRLRPACEPLEEELIGQGWVVPASGQALARWLPLLIASIPVVLGVIKIGVGLSRGKPVEFLVVLCIASTVAVFIGFARAPWSSRRGDAWLGRSRRLKATLRRQAPTNDSRLLSLSIGLFGLGVLTHTSLAHIGQQLLPLQNNGGGDSGSSSGDGGGGGDGGSGCGGCGGGGD